MKFGIFYELQLPRPWQAGDELRLYQNALTQLETADRLGYDHAWVVEHHFLEEYSHSPSPESFLAAASQRTKNIRLGHGIFQLTTNHPARVAERVAVLDLLSNGRCRIRHGRERLDHRADAVRPRHGNQEGSVRGGRSRASSRCSRTAAASITASTLIFPCAMWCRSRCRSRIRRCGWRVRNCRPSNAPASTALARSASSSSAPMPRMPGCTPITTRSPSG